MPTVSSEQESQRDAAARRVQERAAERAERVRALRQPGGIARADTPERIAKRVARLTAGLTLDPVQPAPEADGQDAATVLERIINTSDFTDVRYLEAGVLAARAVGRVNIRDAGGRPGGFGTGSMVSPRLLLTNHHVLPDARVAARSAIEFNFQDDLAGRPLPPRAIDLDPGAFFVADAERDFALVAVKAGERELADFGFNRLIAAEGKAVVGEFVTIVQHPRGGKKQVALRENRIVDLLEEFLHYAADTEPGSSGSPVFNDQWEVVALHHAGVAAPGHDELGGFVNEGIRISRILAFLADQRLPAAARALLDGLLSPEQIIVGGSPSAQTATAVGPAHRLEVGVSGAGPDGVQITIPLQISVRLGDSGPAPAPPARPTRAAGAAPAAEAITIDPDYTTRDGYDPEFLVARRVPLPELPEELRERASVNSAATDEASRHVLPYHHFSVVMNKERQLAFFTAVNIDGNLSQRLKRERDRWFFDPRIPVAEQTGEAVYRDNPLDRGHLVRRLDPAWETTVTAAKRANDDTFHFTNCTPQHADFNQNQTTWAGLEDYILENADNRDFRVTVFTGPVFADDDDEYRGVRLPRQFWKVAAMVKENGDLSATGYLLSQESLIGGLEAVGDFSYAAYRTFQVPVRDIETLTGLSFGELADFDPLAGLEATLTIRPVDYPNQLVL